MVKSAACRETTRIRRASSGRSSRSRSGRVGPLGSLTVYSRFVSGARARGGRRGRRPRAARGPALDNAFRYREARRLADLDALTGLRNRRFFHETLAARVHARAPLRSGASPCSSSTSTTSRRSTSIGHLAGDAVLAERRRACAASPRLGHRLPRGRRRVGDRPPRGRRDPAAQLYGRVEEAVSSQPIGAVARLTSRRDRRARPGRRRDVVLRARRRRAVPGEAGRKGTARRNVDEGRGVAQRRSEVYYSQRALPPAGAVSVTATHERTVPTHALPHPSDCRVVGCIGHRSRRCRGHALALACRRFVAYSATGAAAEIGSRRFGRGACRAPA